eukprot:TRINITY_DN60442_c0_g1_i1.p1 TRINITY_DN60442_c0_g1~~TRINITY_DN60442_c0_g1_i1.p1  ORF type:complete len:155 (+),score=25.18 TRINITY_DN60442_c0_g1_i1:37-465(+)
MLMSLVGSEMCIRDRNQSFRIIKNIINYFFFFLLLLLLSFIILRPGFFCNRFTTGSFVLFNACALVRALPLRIALLPTAGTSALVCKSKCNTHNGSTLLALKIHQLQPQSLTQEKPQRYVPPTFNDIDRFWSVSTHKHPASP